MGLVEVGGHGDGVSKERHSDGVSWAGVVVLRNGGLGH